MTGYLRAYTPEHKAERFADLMETTDLLFREHGFHEVTITTVAKELGWTRSNVYRYAATIEEVFLALYRSKYKCFIDDLIESSCGIDATKPHDLASLFCKVVDGHRDFLDYQSILGSVIETNIPHDMLVEFKRELEVRNAAGAKLIQRSHPSLDYASAVECYVAVIYLACGLNAHFRCAEKQPSAMEEAGVAFGAKGFSKTLLFMVESLLAGIPSAIDIR